MKVNLDALIPREDFEIKEYNLGAVSSNKSTISITDLRNSDFLYQNMRKPDFQRETSEWDPKKVCDFIQSFLQEDLIPAIILWRSAGSSVFIIDGSHRISALVAWVNNDYGDGTISKHFYNGIIPEEQRNVAQKTRNLINQTIGAYEDYVLATSNPNKVVPEIVARAKFLGALAIQLQWVQGDSKKAEASFFKINQKASPIDDTELRILKARRKANGIAARAIAKSGAGHKYWSSFSDEVQNQVELLAQNINKLLFQPNLDSPIKTLDLPIGGKLFSSQSLPLVLEFINITNNVRNKKEHGEDVYDLPDDLLGSETISFLENCKKLAQIINSNHPGSLGLHPIVYTYSANGRHKVASFFAVLALIQEFEKRNFFKKFTSVRADFEKFLLENDYFVQQIVRRYRSASNSYEHIKKFYMLIINMLLDKVVFQEIPERITKEKDFSFLSYVAFESEGREGDFSRETKSEVFIRDALNSALRCAICGGYIHKNSISIDHIQRKQDGGNNFVDNAQLTHPFCNTGFKN